jgi:O-methyltransferase involved in polyketide biosynthesis
VKVNGAALTGISETALLTLRVRAHEARRPDGLIRDPMALRLVDAIDFDYAKFGFTRRQDIALRALTFDDHTRRYLIDHPSATVVALAEGLQTGFWRLDAAGVGRQSHWLTVDLPQVIDLRSRVLPAEDRIRVCSQSALDFSWMDHVDAQDGVFIAAEGLLMYLPPREAVGLITACAQRFPGGQMMFDVPPPFYGALGRGGLRVSRRYRLPPMPFAPSVSQLATFRDAIPGIAAVHDLPTPPGRGAMRHALASAARRLPALEAVHGALTLRPVLTLLEFG